MQDFLSARHPGTNYAQVLRAVSQQPERLPYLAGSLPYDVISVLDERAFLPDDFQHQIHIVARDAARVLLSQTLPLDMACSDRPSRRWQRCSGLRPSIEASAPTA